MSHSFTWENEGVYWKYFGALEIEDLVRANSEIAGHHKLESIKYLIWDATEINVSNLDEMAIEISTTFSTHVDSINSDIKVAFLATDKKLRYLIEKYIDLTTQKLPHAQLKLVDNIDEARVWVR